ncbi:HAD family hydrolase [Neptunomonas sp.]|uniref:HAD family hydrolase n=1 Tax=Neptunomonas sp. TaxID=1971898 RepID=UPI00356A7CEE
MNITNYKTLVFDCDGVLLNSNQVKTKAFYNAALSYGEVAAQQLVDYHVKRGGISRYKKFEWFFNHVIPRQQGPNIEQLLQVYAHEVLEGLLTCEVIKGLDELRLKTKDANWLVVSGGDQQELRHVFSERGLYDFFEGGIFGSPDSKDEILKRELDSQNITQPALFLGDSEYDHQAAKNANLDFVFMNYWTEFGDWENYCQKNNIVVTSTLKNLFIE